jgi:RHH-type proline utilization regulon transcriptional repressor/proline dehydrogenase/delta 1-pyrroline-5-carboxylate dehydrogenase
MQSSHIQTDFNWAGPVLDAPPPPSALLQAIRDGIRVPEAVVIDLAREAALPQNSLAQAQARAKSLAGAVRHARRRASGVDALMHEFSLSSAEGVALMCLAEALLRVPDSATRDRLIADKIGHGDWSAHVGNSPSLFVNATAWGLLLTGRLLPGSNAEGLGAALTGLLRRGGAPLVRRAADLAVRLLGRQFVTGQTIADALAHAGPREARGYRFSYDMLGEAAMTADDADRYFRSYADAIAAIGRQSAGRGVIKGPGISVKLSALHPRYSRAQRGRVLGELLPKVRALLELARSHDINFNIDAEESERLDISLEILEALATDSAFAGWDGIGFVVQAYQKRARAVIDWIVDLGQRSGHRLMIRLVKGAYWDSEIKAAQVAGLADYPVFTRKAHTDVSYIACARAMLAAPGAIYSQFATHNALTIAIIETLAGGADYEFQCLHGMGEAVYDGIVSPTGRACRIYAPVGPHETLLAYLVRRLLENGANTSFVNQIVDPAIDLDQLVADPVALTLADGGSLHGAIPLPPDLLPGRRNSEGVDITDERVLTGLAGDMAQTPLVRRATPITVTPGEPTAAILVRNPARTSEIVGEVCCATEDMAYQAVTDAAFDAPVGTRASLLEAWADVMEDNAAALLALAIREAGKTLANAIGELREAVDFCRYYAATARADLTDASTPIGPVVCISPWNFPLAIFVGQIAASLAAGNPVLAKPAEQTPLIAALAVELAHRAGIPRAALQLLPGAGETIGAALVADPRIAGVMFTGSTAIARLIDRTLAGRADNPVLIAETGGLNAMIVDSTAQPEQVVTDVLASAFDSAGQRCSALRILCLQEEIADHVAHMLKGAMQQLRLGDPAVLSNDIGPVIDAEAQAMLQNYLLANGVKPGAVPAEGTFVAPALLEIDLENLPEAEVFGPVLHVVRWHADQLDGLIDRLNARGYGLTHGIHTRIDDTVAAITRRIHAGNIYVNRNIVGAVVGVQPFGGEGLSGTGPKAGGPMILHRLLRDSTPATPAETVLPGPTGELNVLSLHPRGPVLCHASDGATRAHQESAAQAAGCSLTDDPAHAAAVLTDATGEALIGLRRMLAAQDGPIVPVITPLVDGSYPVWRLLQERSLSVNTAAAGGNAALMSAMA